jgi:hypothetical protein
VGKETVEVLCANNACRRPILFVAGPGIPFKTYCDFCCEGMTVGPNQTPLDTRTFWSRKLE